MIYTIGHSRHPIERFLEALLAYRITLLIDVRSIPFSRRNPQFNQERLADSLADKDIMYMHIPELGGKRQPIHEDSHNQGLRMAILRGFADYMQHPKYIDDVKRIIQQSKKETVCIMCAESDPKKCHRLLIADTLVYLGEEVTHIITPTASYRHEISKKAIPHNGSLIYP